MRLYLGLIVRRPSERRAAGLSDQAAIEAIVDDLVQRVLGTLGDEAILLVPDMHPIRQARGRWGIDEPHPHPDLPFTPEIPRARRGE